MQLNTPLGKDESVRQEYSFSYSPLLFFLKSQFWLTNKRLIVNYPNVFFIIPAGNDTVTYPLKSITGVATRTKFQFFKVLIGVVLLSIGMASLRGPGILWLLLGILFLISGFLTVINVTSASGKSVPYSLVPWEAKNAKKMINELNQLIVDI